MLETCKYCNFQITHSIGLITKTQSEKQHNPNFLNLLIFATQFSITILTAYTYNNFILKLCCNFNVSVYSNVFYFPKLHNLNSHHLHSTSCSMCSSYEMELHYNF